MNDITRKFLLGLPKREWDKTSFYDMIIIFNSKYMKRYIEIVYDNSGSMNDRVGNKKKYEIAQELFEKDILPSYYFCYCLVLFIR